MSWDRERFMFPSIMTFAFLFPISFPHPQMKDSSSESKFARGLIVHGFWTFSRADLDKLMPSAH